jgi:hypothetical protein
MSEKMHKSHVPYFIHFGAEEWTHTQIIHIWGWVKTLVPSEPQNSWVKMDVHPTKNGIYRY